MSNTRKSTGIEKRLPAYKLSSKCHGEFCSLSPIIIKAIQARTRRNEEEKRIKEDAEDRERQDALLKNNLSKGNAASKHNKYFNFGVLVNSALREAADRQREIDAKNLEEAKIVSICCVLLLRISCCAIALIILIYLFRRALIYQRVH